MSRSANSFRRGKPRFKAQPQVLVLCEDAKSSKTYIEDAALHFRATAQVEVAHCGNTDPKGIVQAAIKRKQRFDEVICLIDRDDHDAANLLQAETLARRTQGIALFVSYPCFEFWLLLHFAFTRAPFANADKLISVLRRKPGMQTYSKGAVSGLFGKLLPKLSKATDHAAQAMSQAIEDRQFNPSTPIHHLIERLREIGKPLLS